MLTTVKPLALRGRYDFQWHYRSGVGFYRTYGLGHSEINRETYLAGGGDNADGGGGDYADGGSGSLKTSSHSYAEMGLNLGVIWDGQSVAGISFLHAPGEIKSGCKVCQAFSKRYVIYAEPSLFMLKTLIEENDPQVDIALVLPSSPLSPLLVSKAERALKVQTLKDAKESPCLIDQKSLAQGNIKIRLIRPLDSGREETFFELDSYGILIGSKQKKFEPFIKLGKKNPYIVDLKGLFFMTLHDQRTPLESLASISEKFHHFSLPVSIYYASLPYVYFQRAPGTPAMPAFCKVISDPSIFKEQK